LAVLYSGTRAKLLAVARQPAVAIAAIFAPLANERVEHGNCEATIRAQSNIS
jgi:hypothetical protein